MVAKLLFVISESIRTALIKQLNRELESAYVYLAMSAWCSREEFNGAAHWFRLQYDEEQTHGTKLFDYLIDQGAPVGLLPVGAPPEEFDSLVEVFEASLAHERSMTEHLNDLSDLALQERDHATYNLLQWFVTEQVEEESTVGEIIAKLRLVGTDGYGVLMVDNELGTRTLSAAA